MHIRLVIILIFISIIPAFSLVQAEDSSEFRHVLLINSYNQRMTWVKDIVTAVEDVFDPDDNNIILHIENMDSKQFHTPEYFDSYKSYIKNKYRDNKFSLILSSDNHAFDFLRKYRNELFPGASVVFCGVNNFKNDLLKNAEKFTGVAEIFSARNTVEMALKLHPATKKIFIINDYLTTGRAWEKDIDKALTDMKGKLSITYAQNLSMGELKKTIANLDKDTIVLLGVYFADKDGNYFTYEKVGAMIAGASHVPVYCLLEFNMGNGVMGGEVISGYYQGQAMADIGRRVLDGENPDKIPVLKHGTNQIVFDYLQLERFNVNESSLPDKSIVINKPFSIFQEYKKEIVTVTLMLSALILTIIALVLNILQRNRAEKALRNSEKKHRKLVSNISDVIVILDTNGTIKYKSPNVTEQFGWDPDELIGQHGLITVHPDDKERIEKELMQILTNDSSKIIVEYEYLCKNGNYKPVELTAVNMVDDPIINGVLANYKDISHHREADMAIRKSEEQYREYFEENISGAYISNPEGKLITCNREYNKIFGFEDIQHAISTPVHKLYKDPADRDKFLKLIKKENRITDNQVEMIKVNGTPIHVVENASGVFDENNNLQHIRGFLLDITERKRAEEEQRASEERQKIIFNASPDPVVVYNNKGYPEYMNEAFTDCFGWYLDELRDQHIPFVPEDQNEITKLKIKEIYQSGNPVRFETKRFSKNGDMLDILLSAAIIKGIEGINNSLVVNLKDITGRKKLEAQIQQTHKMESIGTLAGGIAHDFNNILFPVLGHTEMLLQDIPEDNPIYNNLEEIYAGATRAKELVKQILTFSRQEASEFKLIKIQPVIKEALKLIRATIPTTIEIKQDINPDCGAIKADPTQIHQIMMNITTNAYHAMQETGGILKISLKQIESEEHALKISDMESGAYACLTIADTGAGIDKKLSDKIFDPFFTTKEVGKGTGMGLSVVHGIVKSMNGIINVYSEPDKGTEFNVYFPIEKNLYEKQTINVETSIQGGNEHILLVDDEKAIIEMEQNMLERLGYKVTSRSSSLDALEAFRISPDKFDLVITDMQMPNMPGDKLSVELTKIRLDIPVLLCTGFSETMSEEKAESLGINGFLLKPIVMKDLSCKIREVLT